MMISCICIFGKAHNEHPRARHQPPESTPTKRISIDTYSDQPLPRIIIHSPFNRKH